MQCLHRVLSRFEFRFRFGGHGGGSPGPVRKARFFSKLSHLGHAVIPAVGHHKGSQLKHRFGIFFAPEDAVAFQS